MSLIAKITQFRKFKIFPGVSFTDIYDDLFEKDSAKLSVVIVMYFYMKINLPCNTLGPKNASGSSCLRFFTVR